MSKVMMITSPGWNVIRLRIGMNPDPTYVKTFIATDMFVKGDGEVEGTIPQYIPFIDPDSIVSHSVWETEDQADNFIRADEAGHSVFITKGEHTLLPDGRPGQ
jgi:hypothetical protein